MSCRLGFHVSLPFPAYRWASQMVKQLAAEPDLYDRDFYTWALRQAELVRARRLGELDLRERGRGAGIVGEGAGAQAGISVPRPPAAPAQVGPPTAEAQPELARHDRPRAHQRRARPGGQSGAASRSAIAGSRRPIAAPARRPRPRPACRSPPSPRRRRSRSRRRWTRSSGRSPPGVSSRDSDRCTQGSRSSAKASTVGGRSLLSSKLPRWRCTSPGQRSPTKLIGLPHRPQKPRRTPGAEAYSVGGPAGNRTAVTGNPA